MKDGSEEKMMPLFWLHPVACTKFGVNRPKQTKVIERKLNFFLVTVTLTLITDTWEAIPSCVLM